MAGDDHWAQAAAGWARWVSVLDEGAAALSERMCAMACTAPGDRVLDVASGLGEPALTIELEGLGARDHHTPTRQEPQDPSSGDLQDVRHVARR